MPVCTTGRSQPTSWQKRVRRGSDTPSDYEASAAAGEPCDPHDVDLPRTADVVVVGAGIAGASAAWFLAARHLSVVVLEAEPAAGMHATGRSAALLTETYGPPPVLGLVRASRPFIVEPPDGFAAPPLTSDRGALWIARADQAGALRDLAVSWDAPHDELDDAGCRALVGLLRPEAGAIGIHEPGAVDLDVDALLQGFVRGAWAMGAVLATLAPVIAIDARSSGWRVRTRAGDVDTPVVVDAAGAWGDVVAGLAGVAPLGLEPKRRTAFLFSPPVDTSTWPRSGRRGFRVAGRTGRLRDQDLAGDGGRRHRRRARRALAELARGTGRHRGRPRPGAPALTAASINPAPSPTPRPTSGR